MNAAIRAAVRSSLEVGWSVLGVRHGFSGLLRGDYVPLDSRSVSHRIDKGGTLLGTSQQESLATAAKVRQALRSLNEERVDALVSIGGDVSARGGVALGDAGFPVTLIPATIENDLWGTDQAVGVDTAINTAMDVIDRIKDTASSQQQAFVVETAGARSGYLALMVAIVAGAEIACLPSRVRLLRISLARFPPRTSGGRSTALLWWQREPILTRAPSSNTWWSAPRRLALRPI